MREEIKLIKVKYVERCSQKEEASAAFQLVFIYSAHL